MYLLHSCYEITNQRGSPFFLSSFRSGFLFLFFFPPPSVGGGFDFTMVPTAFFFVSRIVITPTQLTLSLDGRTYDN